MAENDNKKAFRQHFSVLINVFDSCAKITGGIGAIFIILAFISPKILWRRVEIALAQRNGIVGYVYYEVGEKRKLTNDGQLFLLKNDPKALYLDIEVGDRLIATSKVKFKIDPPTDQQKSKDVPTMYRLQKGECVIVLEKPKHERKVQEALQGGYLKVASTSCGIFQ